MAQQLPVAAPAGTDCQLCHAVLAWQDQAPAGSSRCCSSW